MKPNLLFGRKHRLSAIMTPHTGVKTSAEPGSVGISMVKDPANTAGRLTTSSLFPKVVPTNSLIYVHFSGRTTLQDKMTACVAKSLLNGTRTLRSRANSPNGTQRLKYSVAETEDHRSIINQVNPFYNEERNTRCF